MASSKINFTKATLAAITPPAKPEGKKGGVYDTYHDTKEKGLILVASNGGAKTFYLYKKVLGKPERIKLGHFPDMSIEQARKEAVDNRSIVNSGKNPNEEKNKLKAEQTFGELFTEFMERYSKKHKKSWQSDERDITRFLSHWFHKKASAITKQDVQIIHEKIHEENGLYQANRLLERIRALYNKAIEWGWNGNNPTNGVKKYKEKSRDRFMQPDELPPFLESLQQEQNTTARDYIWLSLLTGARRGNILAMRWEEISFERKEWRIPETKNGDPLTLPLSSLAIDILITRKKSTKSEWVFPSELSQSGYYQDPKKAWKRILVRAEIYQLIQMIAAAQQWNNAKIEQEQAACEARLSASLEHYHKLAKELQIDVCAIGIKDIRLHDLRRTMGSYQAAAGTSLAIIGKSLGHKSSEATAIYARLNLDPVRQSVEKATETMMASILKNK